jgi:hypothetical protein
MENDYDVNPFNPFSVSESLSFCFCGSVMNGPAVARHFFARRVYFLFRLKNSCPLIMRIRTDYIILFILLAGLGILYVAGFIVPRKTEGFQIPQANICKEGYTFFNDKYGVSMCCRGRVNPFTHACEGTQAVEDLCAFSDNVPDPRNKNLTLSLCSNLYTTEYQEAVTHKCPGKLRHFASDGRNNEMCCKEFPVANGSRCSQLDLSDTNRFCIVKGHQGVVGERCENVKVNENAKCPTTMTKITMPVGQREKDAYPNIAIKEFPACVNMTHSCIPSNVLTHLQDEKMFPNKNHDRWKYSCDAYTRRFIDGDETFQMDMSYIS